MSHSLPAAPKAHAASPGPLVDSQIGSPPKHPPPLAPELFVSRSPALTIEEMRLRRLRVKSLSSASPLSPTRWASPEAHVPPALSRLASAPKKRRVAPGRFARPAPPSAERVADHLTHAPALPPSDARGLERSAAPSSRADAPRRPARRRQGGGVAGSSAVGPPPSARRSVRVVTRRSRPASSGRRVALILRRSLGGRPDAVGRPRGVRRRASRRVFAALATAALANAAERAASRRHSRRVAVARDSGNRGRRRFSGARRVHRSRRAAPSPPRPPRGGRGRRGVRSFTRRG